MLSLFDPDKTVKMKVGDLPQEVDELIDEDDKFDNFGASDESHRSHADYEHEQGGRAMRNFILAALAAGALLLAAPSMLDGIQWLFSL